MNRAEVVLGGGELDPTIDVLTDLGFRLIMIKPADEPRVAVMEGFGLTLRLDTDIASGPGALRLAIADLSERRVVVAPNGTKIELMPAEAPLEIPPLRSSFVLTKASSGDWRTGRAGLRYRDLIPDRQGGRFIASHIHIPDGGPVPDYVHHHGIRFQMIYCHRGWARLVYEDQGPPFRFEAGDCVLQPPHIRHRVLETSSEFDVVEIGCPADHETLRDHDLLLPTPRLRPDRYYESQRFVHHRCSAASWTPWHIDDYEARDLGIGEATDGLAAAHVVRSNGSPGDSDHQHHGELLLWFVLAGGAVLERGSERHRLGPTDSVVLACGERYRLTEASGDLEFLEVRLPG